MFQDVDVKARTWILTSTSWNMPFSYESSHLLFYGLYLHLSCHPFTYFSFSHFLAEKRLKKSGRTDIVIKEGDIKMKGGLAAALSGELKGNVESLKWPVKRIPFKFEENKPLKMCKIIFRSVYEWHWISKLIIFVINFLFIVTFSDPIDREIQDRRSTIGMY